MPHPYSIFALPPGWCFRYLVTSYTTPLRLSQASSSWMWVANSSGVIRRSKVGSGVLSLSFRNWCCDFPTVPVCLMASSSEMAGAGSDEPNFGLGGPYSLLSDLDAKVRYWCLSFLNIFQLTRIIPSSSQFINEQGASTQVLFRLRR